MGTVIVIEGQLFTLGRRRGPTGMAKCQIRMRNVLAMGMLGAEAVAVAVAAAGQWSWNWNWRHLWLWHAK